jgi:hypothetical protein
MNCIPNTQLPLQLTNGPNKTEGCITLGWKGLPETKILAYWVNLSVIKKMKFGECGPRVCIHNIKFSLQLTNGPIKLDCYIALGWISLPGTNIITFWPHSLVKKQMKCVEYGSRGFHSTMTICTLLLSKMTTTSGRIKASLSKKVKKKSQRTT